LQIVTIKNAKQNLKKI